MPRRLEKLLTIVSFSLSLSACGAAATLPDSEESDFSSVLKNAIWHSETGDPMDVLSANSDFIILEDGSSSQDAVVVHVAGDRSTYANGVFLIDIPDRPQVTFQSAVGFEAASAEKSSAMFRVYLQNDGEFVLLSEVAASKDGMMNDISADLSAYRGQSRLLVLSVSSVDASPLNSRYVFSEPQLRSP